ncbi:3-isopropylmalate dehydratase large subunit [Helicobacter mustelae]|uniref:3-isopropylmalate dehydratase large subunit n=1 Tax=Helicobacter mustelae (strain ATCC 43772 / CCUG 25715 / CIP 103759 / LMG 18044 / NCTC 12198 / R85-136P) TaxID=679897 RepID=D3UIF0_HELM1|nr:3-isopropylmalate dehydratase large subunit [Helicobacter mustelae]CBG40273.1 3-isopropylmalate dehydratase large subunit [Helicobacter mustelae 12198]SQH71772.1 3-isopropylmalate dehydratase large subunit [Helicobacter mustelae]STP12901.1 3-isopropylmalate dehydratase large subunit [Helicobacter mustelae]
MEKTLLDKIWDSHVIAGKEDEVQLLYVDLHLIHEVTSPQAFEGLRNQNRVVHAPHKTFGTMDHNVPTKDIHHIKDAIAKKQMDTLRQNCKDFGIELWDHGSQEQGIVHVIGPESGLTQPGKIIVCGDSHTATHGAFGAIAFGIGTSEVEHVLATQSIWQKKPKKMGIEITGRLPAGVYAKDMILALIARFGVDFGTGYGVEFFGEGIEALEMEERMSICNMAIEMGAKIGMIAPDEKTFAYLREKRFAPKNFEDALKDWRLLYSDSVRAFDKLVHLDASMLEPMITWGTNPQMAVGILQNFPQIRTKEEQSAYEYMGLTPQQSGEDIPIEYVFIGSCTNGRLSDLKEAAKILENQHVKEGVRAIIVPGSREVKKRAEELGLDKIFLESGCEWREPGCSMCLGMNDDRVPEFVHCASTSNRNFIGRQGKNARTHLCSPAMAAAAAIHGRFVDVRELSRRSNAEI